MLIEKRIEELAIELPAASAPAAMYIPVKQVGTMLFVSGQIPTVMGVMQYPGHVGDEVGLEEAQAAARLCIINMLAALHAYLGDLDRIKNVVKLQAFVNSAPEFTEQHLVTNGASVLLFEIFGEKGRHARTAVGVSELPLDAPVEIEGIFEI